MREGSIASLATLAPRGSRVGAAAFLTPSQPAALLKPRLCGRLAARSFVQDSVARDPLVTKIGDPDCQ
jgi:hypothetical protein